MTNDWIPSVDECNKAYESKCDYPYSDAGIEAIRALIAERHARAAQSAPGAVSRAEVLEEAAKVCDAERNHLQQFHTTFKSHGGYITALNLACDIRKLKDSPPRAEAAPRGTPFDVEAVVHAVDKKWSTRQQLLDALRTALTEQLAAPRAPEPEAGAVTITRDIARKLYVLLRENVIGHTFQCPCRKCVGLRTLHKAMGQTPTPAREVERHLPSCGWVQVPGGQVAQTGECRCPPRASEDGEAAAPYEQDTMSHAAPPSSAVKETGGLLPCPFCGSEARLGESECGSPEVQCSGRDCCATSPTRYMLDDGATARAIATWNRRAAPSEVSADEVERVARGIHKAHGSVCSMTCGWNELGPQCRDGYLASASYALSLRSAAAKVPSVSMDECERVYTEAAWPQHGPDITNSEKRGIAAVRALFARDASGAGGGS